MQSADFRQPAFCFFRPPARIIVPLRRRNMKTENGNYSASFSLRKMNMQTDMNDTTGRFINRRRFTMKKFLRILTTISLLAAFLLSQACADEGIWYCPNCNAYRTSQYCPDCGLDRSAVTDSYGGEDDVFFDIGIPDLRGQVLRQDQMHFAVYWVQVQLKATGIYYQGEIWDETGNLGDHTMQEIASFMQSRGYGGHSGQVDQTVIDELAEYLGYRLVPVFADGFYRHMDSIMTGGNTGSMQRINSNLPDMVPRVTVGARWVQCCLKKLGYYRGPIDGKYGEATENAVKAFQKDAGFEQRDYVTLGVARAMLERCYYSGCRLDDLP